MIKGCDSNKAVAQILQLPFRVSNRNEGDATEVASPLVPVCRGGHLRFDLDFAALKTRVNPGFPVVRDGKDTLGVLRSRLNLSIWPHGEQEKSLRQSW